MIRQGGGGAPISNRASIAIDRVNGDSTRFRWRGVYADLEAVMVDQGLDPTVTQLVLEPDTDGPCGTLEVIRAQSLPDGTEGLPVDTIELNWYRRERSIWFAPAFAVLDQPSRGNILKGVAAYEERGFVPAFVTTAGNEYQVNNVTAAINAFGVLVVGDTYSDSAGTVSWTRACSQQFATTVGLSGVNKIHTTTSLQTYLTSRGTVIPIFFTLAGIIPPIGTVGGAYTVGWMKTEGSVNIAANGKALLREMWEYGAWNNYMYQTIAF